jgi:hypothetical protein
MDKIVNELNEEIKKEEKQNKKSKKNLLMYSPQIMGTLLLTTLLSLTCNALQFKSNRDKDKAIIEATILLEQSNKNYIEVKKYIKSINPQLAVIEEIKQNILDETEILKEANPEKIIEKYYQGYNLGGGNN